MKKNMGSTDMGIRFALTLVVAILVYFKVVEGTFAYILIAAASIFAVTDLVSFCPLYSTFGLSTCPVKGKE